MKRFFASAAISVLMSVTVAVFAVDGGLDMDGWGWVIDKPSWFSGEFGAEVSSAYLATSGTICDNRPVASQEFDWLVNLGDWGWIDGYAWTISSPLRQVSRWSGGLRRVFAPTASYGSLTRLTAMPGGS